MFDFKDKAVLVTGATGGIGREIAKKFYENGAIVCISGTRENVLNELKAELGDRCHVIPCNLADAADTAALPEKAIEKMGKIDVLVNNAGITRDGLMMRMKDEDWKSVIDVNLTSGFLLSRACLRPMMKQRFGRIIGITSIVGVTGNPGQSNYASAKAGMIGMTKALAAEIANRDITVNCVAPGFIRTPMTDALNDDQKEKIHSSIPMGRMGTPEDIANSVLFLASPGGSYITGQTLHVNGGMAMV